MKISFANPLTKLLATAIVLFAIILVCELLYIQVDTPTNKTGASDDMPDLATAEVLNDFPELSDYQGTINRSLFNWDRKPRNIVVDSAEEGDLTTRWQLTGVVNTANAAYAIFSSSSSPQRLRLQEGMYLERWHIDAILEDQVILSSDGETQVFRLKDMDDASPPPRPHNATTGSNAKQEKPNKKP